MEDRIFASSAPGYPVLLAGLFALSGPDPPVLWARIVGSVLGTLTVGGVIWLGRALFDVRTGVAAGAMAALYPGAVGMSVFVLAEALFCPLMILQLVCWVLAWRASSAGRRTLWAVAGGVAAGLAVLTRPSWLLFTPFVIGCLALWSAQRRRHLMLGMWMLLAIGITMSPWWIRNYRAVGRFVPTTLQVGASLYDGLNPEATGASSMPFSTPSYLAQKREDERAGRSAVGFEIRLDRRLRDAAMSWARAHPREVIGLMGHKFLRMWNIWPNAAEFRSCSMRLIVAGGYLPLLVLGLAGLWQWGRQGWPFALCWLPAVYVTLLHMIFVSSIRYRQPAMLAWIVLAAAALLSWWPPGRWSKTSAGALGNDA